MGRSNKQVLTQDGIDRRETGYYATPAFLASFIAESLLEGAPQATSVFDPCIGKGELCTAFLNSDVQVHGVDVLSQSLPEEVHYRERDFIELSLEHVQSQQEPLPYDLWVANPPYNCHELGYMREHRESIRAAFGNSASLNMYALFVSAMVQLARPGALLGILTLDSFLTAKGYRPLREKLLTMCRIRKILLCPLDLFHAQGAEVRTCYLELERSDVQYSSSARIAVLNRPKSHSVFQQQLRKRQFKLRSYEQSVLQGGRDHSEFLVDVPEEVLSFFSEPRLGEVYPCVTGISTGNDRKYLSLEQSEEFSIPFYKNPGNRKFYTTADAYLISDCEQLSRDEPTFIMRNRQHLASEGITCSSMGVSFSAAYRPSGAYYGVNANIVISGEDLWWLLAYLNSSLISYLVRGVLLRSNMITSGYVSRVPLITLPPQAKRSMAGLAREAYKQKVDPEEALFYIQRIDDILVEACSLSSSTTVHIDSFVSSIVNAT